MISPEPRSWSSWQCPRCSGAARRPLLRGWIELLPEELLQDRPVLSNAYVAALLSTGTIDGVDRHLQDAERWLSESARRRCGDRGA